MKKLFLIIAIICTVNTGYTQVRLPNTTLLSLSGGYSQNGWNASFGSEFLLKKPEHSINIEANYMGQNIPFENQILPAQRIGFFINYSYNFCRFIKKFVSVGISAGANVGYDIFPIFISGYRINANTGFRYGVNISLDVEFYISRKIILFLRPRELFYFQSSALTPNVFQANAGIKVSI